MGIDRTRSSWLPRSSFVLLLVVAVAVVFLHPTSSGGAPPPGRLQVLHGTTGQGTAIELGVRGDQVRWLRTSLSAGCGRGSTWKASWSAVEGAPVHFIMIGNAFYAGDQSQRSYSQGIVGRIGFAIRGTLGRGGF